MSDREVLAESLGKRRWRKLSQSRSAWSGGILVGLLFAMALLAGAISPYEPSKLVDRPYLGMSRTHIFGTDAIGRDVLARVLHGSRLSLVAGGLSIAIAILLGVPLGAGAGYVGGWFDFLAMRGIDVLLSFPSVLIALVLVVAIDPGWTAVITAIGLINMPVFCRQARAVVLAVRNQEYVLASRAAGASPTRILRTDILPSLVSPIIVLGTLGLGTAILEVAGLSFLGISGQPDAAEWGAMLGAAKDSLSRAPTCTWMAPGVAITLTVLGFSLFGDGLRDALEPKS